MSLPNLCDDILIEVSTWCDFITLIQLIKTKRQFSDLFHRDSVWKHKIQSDTSNQETSYYLSYQFLFKKTNFEKFIKPLNLSVKFNSQIFTLLELNKEIHHYWLQAVEEYGYNLKYVKDQTETICLEAVRENSYALQFVTNQTEAICFEAVRKNGYALQYIKDQTEAICLEAVKQDGWALQYVTNQTEAICLEAVRENSSALQYVTDQTETICLEAVIKYGYALEYVKNQTEAICLEAVKRNDCARSYVKTPFRHLFEEI